VAVVAEEALLEHEVVADLAVVDEVHHGLDLVVLDKMEPQILEAEAVEHGAA